jgi:hypothetical protein
MNFPSSKLESAVVELVSNGPIDKEVVLQTLSKQRKVTISALYYALKQLYTKGILVEDKGDIVKINQLWIQSIGVLLGTYTEKLQSKSYLSQMKQGEKVRYVFNSFETCTNFWDSISAEMFELNTGGNSHEYIFIEPNPFWHMFYIDYSNEFSSILHSKGYKPYLLAYPVKNDTQRSLVSRLRGEGYQVSFDEKCSPVELDITIFGDFIIKAKHNKISAENLYGKICNNDIDENIKQYIESTMKPIVFEIIKDSKKASELRKKYLKYFV